MDTTLRTQLTDVVVALTAAADRRACPEIRELLIGEAARAAQSALERVRATAPQP